MYFVSFVLTAQFVLINVVVAVLMKHLDDSNKEAQEEAEMDAEIELELAQGTLCCMGAPSCGGARMDKGLVAAGSGPGGTAGAKERGSARGERGEGARKMRHSSATAHSGAYSSRDSSRTLYSPAQVSVCYFCVCVREKELREELFLHFIPGSVKGLFCMCGVSMCGWVVRVCLCL